MTKQKQNGSYYTPEFLSKFMLQYAAPYFTAHTCLSFLEPSIGDGSFAKAFNETVFPKGIKSFSFTAVEKTKSELRKAEHTFNQNRRKNTRANFTRKDFINYQEGINRKFSLIAGNPPYIKKGLLNKSQISKCQNIHESFDLSPNSFKNLWSAFLIRCTQLLQDNGVIAFVLPAELLQVNFSNQLRKQLINYFERIEIFTFSKLLFECKGQDTILLFGFKKHSSPGQFYTHVTDISELEERSFVLKTNDALVSKDTKWTHHVLSSEELSYIYKLASQLNTVDHFCESKPGIVTAANDFFIINSSLKEQYNLQEYCKPVLEKALYVNGSVIFDENEYHQLVRSGFPTNILCFSDDDIRTLPPNVKRYIQTGEEKDLHKGYKCSRRNNWFVIPNIATPPEGFFFRRTHYYPKLIKNTANVLVTDSAYKIQMRGGYHINNLIVGFYNSLSLAFSEIFGRYYGGGVLELTPKEFKKVPIIDININQRQFNDFVKRFENKDTITDLLEINDRILADSVLKLRSEDLLRVKHIYSKLVAKRFRK